MEGEVLFFGADPIVIGISVGVGVTFVCEPVVGVLPNFQEYIIGT